MTEETVKPGKPWKIVRKCSTFEEADLQRNKIKNENDKLEVKVKFLPSDKIFVVKTRSLAKEEK